MTARPHCWQCGAEQMPDLALDSRARPYSARVRLYDLTKSRDIPEGDSDPELDVEAPGTEICAGLSGVLEYVIQLAACQHNGESLPGLDRATLESKIAGFRPTLSRNGGRGTWRLPYDTQRTFSVDPLHRAAWVARVDVVRVDAGPADQPQPAPVSFRRKVTP